jgi:hypothetical protein
MLTRTRILLLLALSLPVPTREADAQHVHGVVDLGIVVEDKLLGVTLSAPLHDLVGFERKPSSDEQKARLREASAQLSDADALFGIPPSAACSVRTLDIDGPSFLIGVADAGGADGHDDEHDHDEAHRDEHGPGDHDDHHEAHDDEHHDDDHVHEVSHDEHSDVVVQLAWDCERIDDVDSLELRFVSFFHEVEEIRVQLITDDRVSAFDLSGSDRSVPLNHR